MNKETVPFEHFQKLEMKIGTILSAEAVEGADKLLKLTVEVGEEKPRQIIAGIREYVSNTEELIGRQYPFVLNIEPRTIRGLESHGMILAIGGDENFVPLTPEREVKPGSSLV